VKHAVGVTYCTRAKGPPTFGATLDEDVVPVSNVRRFEALKHNSTQVRDDLQVRQFSVPLNRLRR
jgi:hypothetical protein